MTEKAIEDSFCRVTEPGANEILRKYFIVEVGAKQETFPRCEEAGTEGSSLSVTIVTSAQEPCKRQERVASRHNSTGEC